MRRGGSVAGAWLCAALAGCAAAPAPEIPPTDIPPVRFLLTFDDGPSHFEWYNPTAAILDALAANREQPGIKALFFVQTRAPDAGGSPLGPVLLRRTHVEGHLLGLHSGSARGHVSHPRMPLAELEQSLRDGTQDLAALTGAAPTLVRPPYWAYDARTRTAYARQGLAMLLTDINARDGKIYGWNASLRRRSHLRAALERLRREATRGELPLIEGTLPVVVTFHDTNTFTAQHLHDYLRILLEESQRSGLPLADPPFCSDARQIERMALLRARHGVYAAAP
jgi:peptidoglycan/xylan/chitin deacetylase (PgdA/CDA1 family)